VLRHRASFYKRWAGVRATGVRSARKEEFRTKFFLCRVERARDNSKKLQSQRVPERFILAMFHKKKRRSRKTGRTPI